MKTGEIWSGLGSTFATAVFLYTIFQQYLPYSLRAYVEIYFTKLTNLFNPNIQITIQEFSGERLKSNEAYTAIKAYLMTNSSKRAKRLKADIGKDNDNLVLSMDDHEEVTDEYKGVELLWTSSSSTPQTQQLSFYPTSDVKRSYRLKFHKRYRELVIDSYLNHVLKEGRAIGVQKRQRKLYTNSSTQEWYRKSMWSHVVFDHPATFRTLAMDPEKKKEIMDDLVKFSESKEYYAKVGKAWKRGYLLYGPPGTGKSTMIAAMANLLNYDVYDLELTSVKDNTQLRKLLIETSDKAIIVIEDIDCSLDLTGQRAEKKVKEEETDPIKKAKEESTSVKESKVTLSGLLNFIDGLWSSCGGERIIVFTTNYLEKLDPALIRRGRMDKHIEMSYCGFEGFKVLAKNYLDIDSHVLFETMRTLFKETQITPADIAENLMPKTFNGDAETSLKSLIQVLETAKEEARLKAVEEGRLKAEDEAKLKAEEEAKLKAEEVKENFAKDEVKQDESAQLENEGSDTEVIA
ncbi:hypothetical protein GIB67_042678 [Kingdonia uniflora]|uniref:AAA+ ATPase domain-containing protein n=1 Tax=Kingdonia uniflora TaxID=39325 RepID=A0A7J7P302_9MAGN|nr:hypothetical protein GIB67_042678 [Kingdonia uniflora]